MGSVTFCDVTLREGEQNPGAMFDTEAKLELARQLAQVGVQQLQVGFPGLDPRRLAQAQLICRQSLPCMTEVMTNGMGPDWRSHIRAACGCDPHIVHSLVDSRAACSSPELRRRIEERISRICELVHSHGKLCNISFIGAFDAHRPVLLELIRHTSGCADRMRVADSYGIASPEEVGSLVADICAAREDPAAKLGIHCHDDMGLAMANMLAGVRAGADFVDVSVNGMGCRAGNVVLAEAAYVLDRVYGLSSGIDLSRMRPLSELAARLCGLPVHPQAPLVGRHVFDEEVDLHALELLNHEPPRGIRPETVGGTARPLYGKLTTPEMLRCTARNAGRELAPERYPAILEALVQYSRDNPGRVLDESGLWQLIDTLTLPPS